MGDFALGEGEDSRKTQGRLQASLFAITPLRHTVADAGLVEDVGGVVGVVAQLAAELLGGRAGRLLRQSLDAHEKVGKFAEDNRHPRKSRVRTNAQGLARLSEQSALPRYLNQGGYSSADAGGTDSLSNLTSTDPQIAPSTAQPTGLSTGTTPLTAPPTVLANAHQPARASCRFSTSSHCRPQ